VSTFRLSLVYSFAQRYVTLLISFASSLALARILTPGELGIFSVAALFASFAAVLRDFGVSNYLIQERDLTTERVHSAFALTLLIAWFIAALLALTAPFISRVYMEQELIPLILVFSFNFFILPFGSVSLALMRRDMRYDLLLFINLAAALVQTALSIGLAFNNFGNMSLAWGTVGATLTTSLLATILRSSAYPQGISFKEIRHVFKSGSKLSAASLLYEAGASGPELMTGRLIGFDAVGFLSKATGTCGMVLRAVVEGFTPVGFSYFSGEIREGRSIKTQYLKGLSVLTGITFSGFFFIAIFSHQIVFLLFGNQWGATALPLSILCISSAALASANIAGTVLLGAGLITRHLQIHLIGQPLKLIAVLVLSSHGLVGIAIAIALADCLIFAFSLLFVRIHFSDIGLRPVAWILIKAIFLALLSNIAPIASLQYLGAEPSENWPLFLGMALFLVSWLLAVYVLRHPAMDEIARFIPFFRRDHH